MLDHLTPRASECSLGGITDAEMTITIHFETMSYVLHSDSRLFHAYFGMFLTGQSLQNLHFVKQKMAAAGRQLLSAYGRLDQRAQETS